MCMLSRNSCRWLQPPEKHPEGSAIKIVTSLHVLPLEALYVVWPDLVGADNVAAMMQSAISCGAKNSPLGNAVRKVNSFFTCAC